MFALHSIFLFCIFVVALYISYTDVRHHEIWDFQLLLLALLIFLFRCSHAAIWDFLGGSLIALLFNGIIFGVVYWYYGTEQYGMGDVLLHLCAGGFLGFDSYLAFFVTFTIVMGMVAGVLMLVGGNVNRSLPLAPFIVSGVFLFEVLGKPNFLNLLAMGSW